MKKSMLLVGLALALSGGAKAGEYTNNAGGIVADNSPLGLTQTITGTDAGVISSVSVVLNLSGGYNGDLQAYLAYNDGSASYAVMLLDRIGGGSLAASGSGFGTGATTTDYASLSAAGVTLVDGAGSSIHDVAPGAGLAVGVGTYTPDSTMSFNSVFTGLGGSGTWTLYIADLAGGGQSTLVSWGLAVVTVPEPQTWALLGGGLVLLLGLRRRR